MNRQLGPDPARVSCLVLVVTVCAGYGVYRLSRGARRTCRLLKREHPGFFDLWTWEPVLSVASVAVAGLGVWAVAAALVRPAHQVRVRLAIPSAALAVALVAILLVHFAVIGTPTGVASDNNVCSPDNVPPWWPSWLPA